MKNHLKNGLPHRLFPKIDLKVKLTAFLFVVSLFQVQANSYGAKDQTKPGPGGCRYRTGFSMR